MVDFRSALQRYKDCKRTRIQARQNNLTYLVLVFCYVSRGIIDLLVHPSGMLDSIEVETLAFKIVV